MWLWLYMGWMLAWRAMFEYRVVKCYTRKWESFGDKRADKCLEARKVISAKVHADELNLPVEIARKLKGKRVTISEVSEGFLLKPISEDPISEARGILKGKGFTVDRYLQYKQVEKDLET